MLPYFPAGFQVVVTGGGATTKYLSVNLCILTIISLIYLFIILLFLPFLLRKFTWFGLKIHFVLNIVPKMTVTGDDLCFYVEKCINKMFYI